MSGEREIARWLSETSFGRGQRQGAEFPARLEAAVQRVELPEPERNPADFWAVLAQRRSRREHAERPLSLEQLAALLWAARGITAPGRPVALRTAPSAGALYPIDVYVAARLVEGLPAGVWRLEDNAAALVSVRLGEEPLAGLAAACLNQATVRRAAASIVFAATVERCSSKYGLRAARYILLDCAHCCQNVLLAAEALGLSACPVAAFADHELNGVFGLDGVHQAALELATIGHR